MLHTIPTQPVTNTLDTVLASALVCYGHLKLPCHFLYVDLYGNHRIFADDKGACHFSPLPILTIFDQKHSKLKLLKNEYADSAHSMIQSMGIPCFYHILHQNRLIAVRID
eukprot:COSAG02_NODE_108_length_36286_cov_19.437478_25_plen_110_part_00